MHIIHLIISSLPGVVAAPLAPLASLESQDPAPAAPAAPEPPKWTGTVSVGVLVTDGNSDTSTASATGDAEYRRERDRTTVGLWWNFQEQKDPATGGSLITQRKFGGKAKYDYFFTPKTYGLAQGSGEYDLAADLNLRTTVGVGLGHQFREDETLKLSAEVGVALFDEDFESSPDASYTAARGAYNVVWAVSKSTEASQSVEAFPSLEDSNDVFVKGDTRFKMSLTEKMFAQLQWVINYDNTPATGAKRVDNLYQLTIGWSF